MIIGLIKEQQAIAQFIGKSLDENFYWSIVHSRWMNDDTWPIVRERFFGEQAFVLNKIIPPIARYMTKKQIVGHGIGKHSDIEIQSIAKRSLHSLSILLGDKPYFFGDQASSLDVTAFVMVGGLTLTTLDNEMNRLAQSVTNLEQFTQRIQRKYYPEL